MKSTEIKEAEEAVITLKRLGCSKNRLQQVEQWIRGKKDDLIESTEADLQTWDKH
ncbi:MAG: hypothetical protein PHQ43_01090 [Dehalococcoidales bacterium]|nr:hypothetical protein [Dehalococcoidales bacterium]